MPYVIRPAAIKVATPDLNDTGDWPMMPSFNVDGARTTDTGLVDRHGNAIMRVQAPIGFGRDNEQ